MPGVQIVQTSFLCLDTNGLRRSFEPLTARCRGNASKGNFTDVFVWTANFTARRVTIGVARANGSPRRKGGGG